MSLVLFIIVVLIVLALACYVVQLLPIPGPPPIKPCIEALLVVVAIIAILDRAGLAALR